MRQGMVPNAITYTPFGCIAGGMDRGDAVKPLEEISAFLPIHFCVYVMSAVLCVLNIVI